MKKYISLLIVLIMVFTLSACGGTGNSKNSKVENTANLLALKDPTGWGLIKVMTDRAYAFNVSYCDTADEIIAKLKSGETDFATLPLDAAARVYNETNGAVKAFAVSSTGCFHILSNDMDIDVPADLAGRKLYISETEALERLTLDYLLSKTVSGEELPEIITLKNNDEVVAKALEEGSDAYALPVLWAAKILAEEEGVGQVISLKREWDKLNETPFTLGIIVVRAEFAENNPDVLNNLREFAEISLNYVNANTTAGKELLDAELFDDQTVAKKIIPGCYFEYIDGDELRESVTKCLTELYGEDSSAIGGKIPDENFFVPAA